MGLRYRFGFLPDLRPGEKVLYVKPWVWSASFKSLPSYRVFFSLPPLWEAGLYVTDRRVLLVACVFRLLSQEFSIWFPGKAEPGDQELLKKVGRGSFHLLGEYLEIISEGPGKRWYRSRQLRSRLFMRHPEVIHDLISKELATGS